VIASVGFFWGVRRRWVLNVVGRSCVNDSIAITNARSTDGKSLTASSYVDSLDKLAMPFRGDILL
jgi:hypothetical protein